MESVPLHQHSLCRLDLEGSIHETGILYEPLVASLLLVAMPFAPSSVLAPSSDALCS